MTRRARLESKIDRRHEWAEKATIRATAAFDRADRISERFEGGAPILVGHHSEAGARADQRRIHSAMDKGIEEKHLAEYHERKASGLEMMLDRSILSDDDDALEALTRRINAREQSAAHMVAVNAAWRKAKGDIARFAELVEPEGVTPNAAKSIANRIAEAYSWEKQPYPAYSLSNLRASIRRDRERVQQIKARPA
jgi:hypothetical protein